MRHADRISSALIFILGLAAIFFIIPQQIPGHEGDGYALQAADFPRAIAIVMTLLAGILLVSRLLKADTDDGQEVPVDRSNLIFLAMAAAILIVIFLLMKHAGFLIGGAFVIASFMFIMGERRALPIIAMAVLAPICVWGFFWKLLQFPLP
jgi:hypothetical protein